jgi:TRAP-type mannitol/chloroaromatic compound transport system permease large subunit
LECAGNSNTSRSNSRCSAAWPVNLQTSFLTPPFGFSLIYLRSVAPRTVTTAQIYRGAIPFVALQAAVIALLIAFPALITWLPKLIYG